MRDYNCAICQRSEADNYVPLSRWIPMHQKRVSKMILSATGVAIGSFSPLQQHICDQCMRNLEQTYSVWKSCLMSHFQPKFETDEELLGSQCRLCASKSAGDLKSVFCSSTSRKLTIDDMIQFLAKVIVKKDDGLSPYICDVCITDLEEGYGFKKQCLELEAARGRPALHAWQKMEFQQDKPSHLVVELFSELIPNIFLHADKQKNDYFYCSVCKLDVHWHRLEQKCEGCLLKFRNYEDVKSRIEDRRRYDAESEDLEYNGKINQDDSIHRKHEKVTEVSLKMRLDTLIFDVIEEYGVLQKVQRKGPMCCACNQFFLNETEMGKHKEQNHPLVSGDCVCDVCQTTFTDIHGLNRHKELNQQHIYGYCTVCELLMWNPDNFSRHDCTTYNTNCTKEPSALQYSTKTTVCYKCCVTDCGKLYANQETLLKHTSDEHHPEVLLDDNACQYCGEHFESDAVFKAHAERRVEHTTYKCLQCSFKTNLKDSIVKHCSAEPHLPNRAKKPVFNMKNFTVIGIVDDIFSVLERNCEMCCGCSTFFDTADQLTKHQEEIHAAIKDDLPFRCTRCNAGFGFERVFNKHERRAANRVYYYCRPCKTFIWTLYRVRNHKAFVHTNDKHDSIESKYECSLDDFFTCCGCDNQFATEKELADHYRTEHPAVATNVGERYVCSLCHKKFLTSSSIKRHIEAYSERITYKCKVVNCVFKTNQLWLIKRHAPSRIHRDIDGKSILGRNVANEHKCCIDGCVYVGTSSEDVKLHSKEEHRAIRAQHGELFRGCKVTCPVCRKGFNSAGSLSNHQYARERKAKCDICKRYFKMLTIEGHVKRCKQLRRRY